MNVIIHQFQPGGAVVDAAALAQFQEQWATYRKLVESGCLAHREVGGILHGTLNEVFTSPFQLPRYRLRRCQHDEGRADRHAGPPLSRHRPCRRPPSSSPPPISPGCRSRSISTTAISSKP